MTIIRVANQNSDQDSPNNDPSGLLKEICTTDAISPCPVALRWALTPRTAFPTVLHLAGVAGFGLEDGWRRYELKFTHDKRQTTRILKNKFVYDTTGWFLIETNKRVHLSNAFKFCHQARMFVSRVELDSL